MHFNQPSSRKYRNVTTWLWIRSLLFSFHLLLALSHCVALSCVWIYPSVSCICVFYRAPLFFRDVRFLPSGFQSSLPPAAIYFTAIVACFCYFRFLHAPPLKLIFLFFSNLLFTQPGSIFASPNLK